MGAEVPLATTVKDHGRQVPGEGASRQTPIADIVRGLRPDKPVCGNGQQMGDNRRAQERMQKRPGARPRTITPEELGIDEAAQLTGLGGRQVVDLAQPGVRRDRSRPERLLASIGKQRPDATPGPSAEAGQKR